MKTFFIVCILTMGIFSCSEYKKISVPTEQETQVVQAIGDSLSKVLFKALQTKLKSELQSGGPKAAIKVCSQEALVIADEIAASALFLASDEADFITGELLIVAGGRGMH